MEAEILQFDAGIRLIPARLTEAREARGLTMTDLGKLVGVTTAAISQYENGTKQPEWETLAQISGHLEQSVNYFSSERPPGGEPIATAFFRSFRSKTKSCNKMLRRWSVWAAQVFKYLSGSVNFPAVSVPPPSEVAAYDDETIDQMATHCRRLWGLSDGPIANMVALLESKGFVVIRSEFGMTNVDAFSCWQDQRPFIFLSSDKECAVRSRFDAAHELGHLLLHRHVSRDDLEDTEELNRIEREANRFASAFLLPARTFVAEIFSASLSQFLELKKRWKVSIAAMIHRCKDLGVFDEQTHVNLRKQLSFHRWIKEEPLDRELPCEQCRLLGHSIKLLIESKIKSGTDFLIDLRLSAKALMRIAGLHEDIFSDTGAEPEDFLVHLKPI